MNYLYCQKCFKKTAQTSDVIRFCSHCGKPFVESITSTTTNTPSNNPKPSSNLGLYRKLLAKRGISEEDENEDLEGEDSEENDLNNDEVCHVPQINQLKVEIDIPQNSGIPIRSLARSAKRQPRPESNNKKPKINKKKFLQDFQRQTASIRPKT